MRRPALASVECSAACAREGVSIYQYIIGISTYTRPAALKYRHAHLALLRRARLLAALASHVRRTRRPSREQRAALNII